jgi:hypothetical protein
MKSSQVYEFLKDVGALGGIGWLVKTAFTVFTKRLTRHERELLAAALTMSEHFVWRFNIPNAGKIWVRAGKLDLGDSRVPDSEYVDALESLVGRGYLRRSQGDLFVLSGRGLRAAKRCAARIKINQIPCEQNSSEKGSKSSITEPWALVG